MTLGERIARERLIEELRILADAEMDVTLVFDGRGRVTEADAAISESGFRVCYAAAAKTSDGVIERLAASDHAPARCVVVTSDATVRGNVLAAGGEAISPDELRARIDRARERARRVLLSRRTNQGGAFNNKLPL